MITDYKHGDARCPAELNSGPIKARSSPSSAVQTVVILAMEQSQICKSDRSTTLLLDVDELVALSVDPKNP